MEDQVGGNLCRPLAGLALDKMFFAASVLANGSPFLAFF